MLKRVVYISNEWALTGYNSWRCGTWLYFRHWVGNEGNGFIELGLLDDDTVYHWSLLMGPAAYVNFPKLNLMTETKLTSETSYILNVSNVNTYTTGV
jgi:hypothetical protein